VGHNFRQQFLVSIGLGKRRTMEPSELTVSLKAAEVNLMIGETDSNRRKSSSATYVD